MKGEAEVRTTVGAIVSLIIMLLTLGFALLKMQDLFSRRNPNINYTTEDMA